MSQFTLNLLSFVVCLTASSIATERSANLSNCDIKDYPYAVAIYERASGKIVCGGSIFTPEIVLSGGQCCNLKPSDHAIVTGMQMVDGKKDQNVTFDFTYRFHRNTAELPPYMICILKLSSKLHINQKTSQITIPRNHEKTSEVVLLGYTNGPVDSPQKLLCAKMAVLPEKECNRKIPKIGKYGYCLRAVNEGPVCRGDEGSPVLSGSQQVCVFIKQNQFANQVPCGVDKVQICVKFKDDLRKFYMHRLGARFQDHSGFLDSGSRRRKGCILGVIVTFVFGFYLL